MKFNRSLFLAIFVAALMLFSCDKVKHPYYTVKSGGGTTTEKKVLLEEFTGHKCVNCPTATETAHTLENLYNGNLIVLAIHAGIFADTSATGNYTLNLTSATGSAWYSDFGVYANPLGMINRQEFSGSRLLNYDLWADTIAKVIQMPPTATISISNTFSISDNTLNTTIKSKFLNVLSGSYTVTACIMEDSIIGAQKNSDPNVGTTPDILNYVFMHVLRGSINGNYGELLTDDIDTGQVYTKNYSFKLKSTWNPKHCSVLAFVSNADTKEILQAEKARIIQ